MQWPWCKHVTGQFIWAKLRGCLEGPEQLRDDTMMCCTLPLYEDTVKREQGSMPWGLLPCTSVPCSIDSSAPGANDLSDECTVRWYRSNMHKSQSFLRNETQSATTIPGHIAIFHG